MKKTGVHITYIVHELTDEFAEEIVKFAAGIDRECNKKTPAERWLDRHMDCPRNESHTREKLTGKYGPDCLGFDCRGFLQHDSMQAVFMIQAAMNQAEFEKIHPGNKVVVPGESPTKAVAKIESLARKLESVGADATPYKQGAERIKKIVAPTPGRQKGKKPQLRSDKGPSRLAVKVASALRGCGIPVDSNSAGFGLRVVFDMVTAVFGPQTENQMEMLRNAIRRGKKRLKN